MIRIRKRPATDTEELSSTDLLSGEEAMDDALDAEMGACDDESEGERHDTPAHIRAMAENAPSCDEDDAAHLLEPAGGGHVKTTLVLIALSLAVLVGFLAFRARAYTSRVPEYNSSASAAVTTAGIEDVTDTPEPMVVAPQSTVVAVKTPGHTCDAPKTDREWMECAKAAYLKLRTENAELEAQVAEANKAPRSTKNPTWLLYGALVFLSLVLIVPWSIRFAAKWLTERKRA